jgi:hypothetical protein
LLYIVFSPYFEGLRMFFKSRPVFLFLVLSLAFAAAKQADARNPAEGLAAHKALYEIRLVSSHSGSQILNVGGQMEYEWTPSCDSWLTNHKFNLLYEYADSPGMRIASNFSSYESADGAKFNFSSRRQRDGEMYQEIRGNADTGAKGGSAIYSLPENLKFKLAPGTLFPTMHTLELARHARAGDKFYNAAIFDGSDEDGPVEINSFIGKEAGAPAEVLKNPKVDASLLKGKAWNIHMAFFPQKSDSDAADYEMSMIFHENGIISDMLIDYGDFSVRQKLLALAPVTPGKCDG